MRALFLRGSRGLGVDDTLRLPVNDWLEELALSTTELGDAAFEAIGETCTALRRLDVHNCHRLQDPHGVFPRLQHLSLSSGDVTSASIETLVANAPLLSLYLAHCSSLQTLSLSNPTLRRVDLSHCTGLHSLSLTGASLEQVTVDHCMTLMHVDLDTPRLKHVSAQHTPPVLRSKVRQVVRMNGL
jgi:Leucine-rich repeat (LRR) protein